MPEEKVTIFGYLQEMLTGYAIEPVPGETFAKLSASALKSGGAVVMRTGVPIEKADKMFREQRESRKIFTAEETIFLAEAAQLLTGSRLGNKSIWLKFVGYALAANFGCGFNTWSSAKILVEFIFHLEDGGYFEDGYKTIYEFFQNV
jgi:hypothetical protein